MPVLVLLSRDREGAGWKSPRYSLLIKLAT